MTTTTRTTRTRTTTETLITTATGTTTRTRTTTTTRTTTRTRKAPAAASEPEVPPSPPAAPAQEAGPPAEAAPVPPAPRSPRADQDPKDPAPVPPGEKKEVFEGVRIRVGSVHPRGGYVHWRSRRHVIAALLEVGIPAEVPHHRYLMTDGLKPSATAYKRAEKLIAQVRQARARGKDPAPLWMRWMPSAPPAARKAA